MGSGDWFKTIISLKKVKEDRSKQVKVDSATKKSNGSKWRYLTGKASSSLANGASSRNAGVLTMPIKDIAPTKIQTAATKIQSAFRAYMARKALPKETMTMRSQTMRSQALMIEGHSAIKQASAALNHIHSWSRIQAQIRARRLSMVTEGQIRQKKLENQLKLEAKLHELEVEWCGGSETMEEILSRIQQREEAAVKRERAMAYAFSHQWRANSGQYFGHAYYDIGKESWGWSWMERWIAVRPWETRIPAVSVPKKVTQTTQGSKIGKITNQPATKVLVSIKPTSSNGKGTSKARKLSYPSAEKEVLKEADTEALSFSQSETDETKTK
uniref:Protein IQ-DOMAIN 1 n=1 Tax=Davidia involucrata TaxID=16924 RepID=A0A5B7BEY9_DAVIN